MIYSIGTLYGSPDIIESCSVILHRRTKIPPNTSGKLLFIKSSSYGKPYVICEFIVNNIPVYCSCSYSRITK